MFPKYRQLSCRLLCNSDWIIYCFLIGTQQAPRPLTPDLSALNSQQHISQCRCQLVPLEGGTQEFWRTFVMQLPVSVRFSYVIRVNSCIPVEDEGQTAEYPRRSRICEAVLRVPQAQQS